MKRVRLGLIFLLLFLLFFNFSVFAKSSINNKTSYQLNFKSKILKIGESFNLKVISKSQSVNNLKVAFSSSNNRVASVDKNGRVRAIGVGYAEIRAEIKDKNIRLACIIQVKPNEVEKISLNVRKLNLKVGETYELSAKVYPNNATNKDLIWINSNPEIVEVYNGKVFAKKLGHSVVTVYSHDKKAYDKCLISIIDEEIKNFPNMPLEEQAEYVIKNYCKDGYYILESVANKKNDTILNLIKKWKMDELFNTIKVAVHEECHDYQNIMNKSQYDWNNRFWIINQTHILNGQPIVVKFVPDKLFKTELALNNIPENLKTLRWKTYVSSGSQNASNVYGIYGLLQEYEAYYHGDKAVYDTFEYVKKIPFTVENFSTYYERIGGTAFYEFTYYILSYLKYAQENRPDVYNIIINDENFRLVFKYVYTNYKSLVEEMKLKRAQEIKDYLIKMGYDVEFGVFDITISGNGSWSSISTGSYNIFNLKKELEKEEYKKFLNEILK